MGTSEINQKSNFNEHKRKVFFEKLSAETTTNSLHDYLSEFPMETCIVPYKKGQNQGHGFVTFSKESSVNTLMSKRPHRIDDQLIEIYRSVPDQGPLKEKKGIKNLIVTGIRNGLLSESDLSKYFCGFGKINYIDMQYEQDSCCIEFDDYDAVDKALLDIPHIIKKTEVSLKKGRRDKPSEIVMPSKTNQTGNNNSTLPMKSVKKQVQIDSRVSIVNIPRKTYCIYIKNLPSNATGEILAKKFDCSVYDILMHIPADNQSLPIECWLKDVDDLQTAECFVQRFNGQTILGSTIECEIEEDRLELCKKFRLGECRTMDGKRTKMDDECDWNHINCIANGTCPNDCPYGHPEGMKKGYIHDESNEAYRIKITGFREPLTPKFLAQTLQFQQEQKCYVNSRQAQTGYIVQLRTMKYAQRLMKKWHNREIDGQILQCQLELNTRSTMFRTFSSSRLRLNREEEIQSEPHRHSRICQQSNNSTDTSRYRSVSRDNKNSEITVLHDQDIIDEGRLFAQSRDSVAKQKQMDDKRKASSVENIIPLVHFKYNSTNDLSQYGGMLANEPQDGGRRMSQIRKKSDYGSVAFLIGYKDTDKETYQTELNALNTLQGVKGVVQLVKLDETSNTMKQQQSNRNQFDIVTERPSGYPLKEFVDRIHHGGFGVLEAIQLAQSLIAIVKSIHYRGVLHQNIEPENILIEWDSKNASIDQAQLTIINFSQSYIISNKRNPMIQSTVECWYKAPQSSVESFEHSSTIDASGICAILLWLLTNIKPRRNQHALPHEQQDVEDKLNRKITEAIRIANTNRKQTLQEKQLKTYLIDTLDIGFGYPEHQPWIISDLECRLESIRELLSPRNPTMNTSEAIFQDLLSTNSITPSTVLITHNLYHDILERASNAFYQAKKSFSESNQNRYSWSDGGCAWMDSSQNSMNHCRHDDILTYFSWNRNQSSSFSIIITSLATVIDSGNIITLSMGSTINGKMSRIPIGRYPKSKDYIQEFKEDFISELNNLIISICKERKAIQH